MQFVKFFTQYANFKDNKVKVKVKFTLFVYFHRLGSLSKDHQKPSDLRKENNNKELDPRIDTIDSQGMSYRHHRLSG